MQKCPVARRCCCLGWMMLTLQSESLEGRPAWGLNQMASWGRDSSACAWTSPKGSDDEIISCAVYFGAGEVERCAEKPSRYSGGSR